MYQSPRMRRLRNDFAALERLQTESSIFRFTSQGDPAQQYRIMFHGRGLWRDHGKVKVIEKHHVEIKLGSSYPRTIPELRWLTPVYHPNISEIGMVCLGGYGTHWVPSVQLDELCSMLWDMVRYHNYDIRSPYNRDAALWVAQQQTIRFPTDARPMRDLRAALGRVASSTAEPGTHESSPATANGPDRSASSKPSRSDVRAGIVRGFAERYGRVFGVKPDEPRPRRTEPAEAARSLPANSELRDLVAAQETAPTADETAAGAEPVFILDPDQPSGDRPPTGSPPVTAEGAPSRPLFARPQRASSGAPAQDAVDVGAEIRRLMAAGGRGPSSAPPPADEIVFIE
jgi:ubiquitin-protein ligase